MAKQAPEDFLKLDELPANLKLKILSKLNLLDGVLSGEIEEPPSMSMTTNRKPKKSSYEEEKSSTLFVCEPPSENIPLLFDLKKVMNSDSTRLKYHILTSDNMVTLQNNGYLIVDNFLSQPSLVDKARNAINDMQQSGALKNAGMMRQMESRRVSAMISVTNAGIHDLNGRYLQLSGGDSGNGDHCYGYRSDKSGLDYSIKRVDIAMPQSNVNQCWAIIRENSDGSDVIYYYSSVAQCDISDLARIDWLPLGGIEPMPTIHITSSNSHEDEKDDKTWLASDIRSDLHCWMHSNDTNVAPSLRSVITEMDKIRVQLNQWLAFNSDNTQVQITCYPGNETRYRTHIDALPLRGVSANKEMRRLTCLLYLNDDDWSEADGGCLKIYLKGGETKLIQPLKNRCLLFFSQWLPHEVLPCHSNRYAITMWMY